MSGDFDVVDIEGTFDKIVIMNQVLRENKCIASDQRAFRAETGRDPWDRRCPIDCRAQRAERRMGCLGYDPNAYG